MKKKEIKYIVNENNCWICTSHKPTGSGYPVITINGKQYSIHRYMYEMYKHAITKDVIRHICDNPLCINPEHLIEGTHNDNVQDRVARNRSAVGINNGRSKLTEKEVLIIFNDNITPKVQLAKKYKIDPKVIRDIKQKKKWKHITNI